MSLTDFARKLLPRTGEAAIVRAVKRRRRAKIERLAPLSERDFTKILAADLGLSVGDTVYVHSATDGLHLSFPFYRILFLIQQIIGPRGTMLFPTYPNRRVSSYEHLLQGHVFDVRTTPSYTGLLTEFARRRPDAVRSLHPIKSVCAIGAKAAEMTSTHQLSPYPYDACSPYYKLVEYGAKIVGLGAGTEYLTIAHAVDDALKEKAPVRVYHPRPFAAPCVNYAGEQIIIETYAHDMKQVVHDLPRIIKTYVPAEICENLTVKGMRFCRADAPKVFEALLGLARQGISIYLPLDRAKPSQTAGTED
jgi:aminoglycoside N3'-acetyltransferase